MKAFEPLQLPPIFFEQTDESKIGERRELSDLSYYSEMGEGINREVERMEMEGFNILCVLVFGSIANAMKYDQTVRFYSDRPDILASDIDFVVLVEKTEQTTGKTGSIQFGKVGRHIELPPLTPRIPNADMFSYTVGGMKRQLAKIRESCVEAGPTPKKYSFAFRTDYVTFLQALVEGIVIRGEIPDELELDIQETIQAFGEVIKFQRDHGFRL